jgi:large subunit ribosomal protein L17
MLRNLTANLVLHERIQTTDTKAKELRRVVERLITKAVRLGDVAFTPSDKLSPEDKARRLNVERQIGSYITRIGTRIEKGGASKRVDLVEKILLTLAKRFKGRPGGYTRIIKLANRKGDNAPQVFIEFVGELQKPADAPVEAAAAE